MKAMKALSIVLILFASGAGLWGYWRYNEIYPSTQDAYLRANIVHIAAQVPGRVSVIHVSDNQLVSAGDLLVELDSEIHENNVKAARAQVESASSAQTSYAEQVKAALAAIDSANTAFDEANKQLRRTQTLFDNGTVSQAALDRAFTAHAQAQAGINSASAQLTRAKSEQIANQDSLLVAQSNLATALVNLDHTKIFAPADGWVSHFQLRVGTTLVAYQQLFSVVESDEWWVEANFKETDMKRIQAGQPVNVSVDMLPGQTFQGEVMSIGAGSGATFALLPAENASGNWVKVTQRFPIRISVDPRGADFRSGASVTARVDTSETGSEGE